MMMPRREEDPVVRLDRTVAVAEANISKSLQAKAKLDGQLQVLAQSAADTRREMTSSHDLRSCEKTFKEAVVESTLLENIVADLDSYHKALDSALMRYHKLKVAEINSIIRELWSSTYQGADIDNIEIRSDVEDKEDGASAVGKGSKSYNYRVVMLKGDAELDMRGRCSAGQKVLSSIVIRLALAETFCVSTGVLALDEPTTNLDLPNKKGLAQALARVSGPLAGPPRCLFRGSHPKRSAPNQPNASPSQVIELRAGANLQLIVITHDEEFVSELGRATQGGGGPDSKNQIGVYYRVFREEVRPGVYHSFIEQQEFE